jgi:hypothetical protein
LRPWLLAAASVAAGCGPPGGFSQLGPFKVQSGAQSLGAGVDTVLRYETGGRGCQVLAIGFSATVNGESISTSPGVHRYDSRTLAEICEPPGFSIPRPKLIPGPVTVEARSGDDTLAFQIEDVGRTIPAAALLAPGEVAHVGQTIQVVLGTGWERLSWPNAGFVRIGVDQPVAVTGPVDGVLQVTMPDLPNLVLGPTNAELQIWPRSRPEFSACDAPLGCAIGTDVTGLVVLLKLNLVIAP